MKVLQLISVVLTGFVALYYYFTRTFNYWKSRNVRGPQPILLFGNFKDWILRRKHMSVIFKEIYDKYPNEKFVGMYRMITPTLLLRDLDVIKQILIKDFNNFEDRGIDFNKNESLGQNLFHADGETWRALRKKFTPMFTSAKLKHMLHLMIERSDMFTDYIQRLCENSSEHEVYSLMQKYTISSISACAFGLDMNSLDDKMEVLDKLNKLILSPAFFSDVQLLFPGILKQLNLTIISADVRNFFDNLVRTVISQRNGIPSERKDFMDLMLEQMNQKSGTGLKLSEGEEQMSLEITENVMAAQAFVFYVGGYETSATTMSFMLYELAKNPHIQDKLIEEIDEVLKKHNGEVTYDALKQMTYMHQVFDETLRLYPVVEPIQRKAKIDYRIPDTNVDIKKGLLVIIPCLAIHRDPRLYPDPDKFDPERFTAEAARTRHTCAYMPFGVGPRNCIGLRFGKLQSEVCMAKFLSRFRVTLSENTVNNIKINPKTLSASPRGGIYLNILPRKR